MDFESIVEKMLFELGPGTPTMNNATSDDVVDDKKDNKAEDEAEKQGLAAFIKKQYQKIADAWANPNKSWNKTYPLLSVDKIEPFCWNVIYGVKLSTTNVKAFDDIANIFPLLDLAAQLYDNNFKQTGNKDPQAAEATLKSFLDNLNKQRLTRPFDYTPSHAWAKKLKEAAFATSKNELGKARVANLPKDLTIYGTLHELMEIRKKSIFPKLSTFAKNFNGEGILKSIMLKPWEIVSGKYTINDDKIKSLYDGATVQELVNLSLATYNLYVQQAQSALGEEAVTALKDSSMYTKFVGADANAVPMIWKKPNVEPEAQQNASFDQSFELLYRQMLSETSMGVPNPLGTHNQGNQTTTQSSPLANTDYMNRETPPNEDPSKPEKTEEVPTQPQAFQTGKEGEYLYSLDSIKKASAAPFKHPEAIELLTHFESLANYIKTKENRDIIGGLTQIAKGMQVAPQMGR